VIAAFGRVEQGGQIVGSGRRQRSQPLRPARLPKALATICLDRRRDWRFPHLKGVASAPPWGDDGSIVAKAGFDEKSRLYCQSVPDSGGSPPDQPTKADAAEALHLIRGHFQSFRFEDARRSCWP
jgi:hypothetical protein